MRAESRGCRHLVGFGTSLNASITFVFTPTLCKGGGGGVAGHLCIHSLESSERKTDDKKLRFQQRPLLD